MKELELDHISYRPDVLLKNLQEKTKNIILIEALENNGKGIFKRPIFKKSSEILEIEGYWLKKDEYDSILKSLFEFHINLKNTTSLEIKYIPGLYSKELGDFYEATYIFK